MQVVLHAGVHTTDEDRLIRCLLKNRDSLHDEGVSVPGPSRYRRALRDALHELSGQPPAPGARERFLDRVLDHESPDRLVLSNENFFCVPKLAIGQGRFYPNAEAKLADFRAFFADDRAELFLAVRNPATYLPDVFNASPQQSFDQFMGGTDPLALRWSDLIARIREALPDLAITVWCQEDTPLIWGEVMRDMAGLPPSRRVLGEFDMLHTIMSEEGIRRFDAYLAAHRDMTELQRRRAAVAFLDKFALEDALEEELSGPDWDALMIDMLTEVYEEDMFEIERLPGVHFITP